MRLLAAVLALVAGPATAQDVDQFVEANVLSIFYHELGHALIDVMDLPVFGQEEDAADTASILLIDASFDAQTAAALATDAALGFAAEADLAQGDVVWWDEHGADLQRYYNLVCLFYGADPEAREDFAQDMGLPEDRAEKCGEEYDLAIGSWGPVFEEMLGGGGTQTLRFEGARDSLLGRTVAHEVAALNAEITLPTSLRVVVKACDEANAFYDPQSREIIMCTEFEPHLRDLAQTLD